MIDGDESGVPAETKAVKTKDAILTKAHLTKEVSRVLNVSLKEGAALIELMLGSMVHALERGERVEIRGFGSFRVRQRGARVGRNPKSGARVEVPAKKIPAFKPSKELRELVEKL